MATGFSKKGDIVDVTAGGTIASNDLVALGPVVGVAINDAESGDTLPIGVTGEWTVAKVTGTAIAAGDVIDFDLSLGAVTTGLTPAAGDVSGIGVATVAAGSADTSVTVLLTPGTGTVT